MGVDPFLAVLDDDGAVGDVVGPSKWRRQVQVQFTQDIRGSPPNLQLEYAKAGNSSSEEDEESEGRSVTDAASSEAEAAGDDMSVLRRGPRSSVDIVVSLEGRQSLIWRLCRHDSDYPYCVI